ncbi:alkaline phosphatase [Shewanella eurypsychrophilus]|uniref:Alkaline phosphatase n=1 Tax=Shewanella eurypsychrophilus TaxID=2593656 RepID=A0ABX6V562_9GAMM|nr:MULTISPECIES: alkaline phosphatase [Shewanella]QFU21661.1 alkaline phosphatase [Shewanella sp. YLB-09]QPG56951.1 alkaline phosphatase [Shewanella eurypsychrophilus]
MNVFKFSSSLPYLSVLGVLTLVSSSLSPVLQAEERISIPDEDLPRNIIYLIGDGMGPAYTSAYRYFSDRPDTKHVEETIFDQLLVGMSSTYPDDDTYVTDSAAAATALATSHKSYNGAISVDHQQDKLPTMMEMAKERGKATAIVVTSQINHATPASFLAHNESRRNYNQIADSYLTNLINGRPIADLMLGGGTQYFVREDKDLTQEFQHFGYQYIDKLSDLSSIDSLPALGLFAPSGMEPALGSHDPYRLTTMTQTALKLLSKQTAPFVMMVEGSQIDWCGHSNDIVCAMNEMDDFAKTLIAVKHYVDTHPDTLLVATADHSTGGLTLGREGKYKWKGKRLKQVKMLPEDVAKAIVKTPSILDTPKSFSAFWSKTINISMSAEILDRFRVRLMGRLKSHEPADRLEELIKQKIDKLTYTGWTTSGHNGIDVQIFAYGKGQQHFNGHLDNTKIAATLIEMIKAERFRQDQ